MALGRAGGGRGRRQAFLRCVLVASIGLVFPQACFVPPGKVAGSCPPGASWSWNRKPKCAGAEEPAAYLVTSAYGSKGSQAEDKTAAEACVLPYAECLECLFLGGRRGGRTGWRVASLGTTWLFRNGGAALCDPQAKSRRCYPTNRP